MGENAIETKGLTKVFGQTLAVNSLDLAVPKGSVFGFLGVNGAGKTTTVRMIMGHLRPTSGEVYTLGADPWSHSESDRRRIAYVSENMDLPPWMTPERAICFNASFYPNWDSSLAERLLDEFELRGAGRYRSLSKGQKRSLCLLLALCQNAELFVLDEPTLGLDVVARHKFLDHILELVYDGRRTVFISSHLLSDLERVVDRVAIIREGHLRLTGELDALKDRVRKIYLPVTVDRDSLSKHFDLVRYESDEKGTIATVLDFDEGRFRALCEAHRCGEGAKVYGFNLEDFFAELEGE
jgi:ABC-2 type transport system ATP-binding protein